MLVAVVDSGIHAGHPHVGEVAGGIHFRADGATDDDWIDRLGHGTAVAAAIREKAPGAGLLAVRVFERSLATSAAVLARAIAWSAEQGAAFINLSLGTANPAHAEVLRAALAAAVRRGATVVAAARHEEVDWYPGALPGAVGVLLDWECPRGEIREVGSVGARRYAASGYPRPIPGVPPEWNLKGISFAVANVTGVLVNRAAAGSGARPPGP